MGKLVIALAKCGEFLRVPIQPLIARRLMKAVGWNQTPPISLIHIKLAWPAGARRACVFWNKLISRQATSRAM